MAALSLFGDSRRLPAYFLFEMICLAPWTVWLYGMAVRRDPATTVGVIVQGCVALAIILPIQIVGTQRHLWEYCQDKDVLLGTSLGGVPIEEFLFYPLAINFAVLLYLQIGDCLWKRGIRDVTFVRGRLLVLLCGVAVLFAGLAGLAFFLRDGSSLDQTVRAWDAFGLPRYAEGPRGYEWTIITMTSVAVNSMLLYLAERFTSLMMRALVLVYGIFFLINFLVELIGTSRGWWVYNGQQVSGLWVAAIPLENLAVYVTGVTLSLAVFETARCLMSGVAGHR